MGKLKVIGKAVVYLTVFFSVMFGVSIGATLLLVFYGVLKLQIPVENVRMDGNISLGITLIMYMILLTGFGLWYCLHSKKKYQMVSGMTAMIPRNVILVSIIGVLMQILTQPIMLGFEYFFPQIFKEYMEMSENIKLQNVNIVFVILCIVLIGPVTEELFFRGILYRTLRQEIGFMLSALIASVIFGIYHMNVVQGVYCFAVGFVMCYIYEKTQSFLTTSILHIVFNGSAYLLEFFLGWIPEKQMELFRVFDRIIFAICFSLFLFAISKLKSYQEVANENV